MLPFLLLAACGDGKAVDISAPQNEQVGHMGGHTHSEAASDAPGAVIDPVCGMREAGLKYTDSSIVQGSVYHFCSPHCKEVFDKAPEKYTVK